MSTIFFNNSVRWSQSRANSTEDCLQRLTERTIFEVSECEELVEEVNHKTESVIDLFSFRTKLF